MDPARATRLAQTNDGGITQPKPVTRRPAGRPATAQPSTARASTSNEAVSTGTEPTDHQDAVLGAPTAKHPEQSALGTSRKTPEGRPVAKIAQAKAAAPLSLSPPNPWPPAASLPPTLSTPKEDDDGSVNAKPAPKATQGDGSSPPEAKPHRSESLEMPSPRRSETAPGAADPLPPAAAMPEHAPPDTQHEGGDDTGPPPELRVVAAHPTAPIRIETPAALASVQHQDEGRAKRAPSRPVPTPESPKVQIGLLEVVVQAPASAPKGAPLANKARTNIASRYYLRNM